MHPVSKFITTAYRKPGRLWSLGWHTGVDYACGVGTRLVAPAPGYVARVAYDRSYGNYIMLRCNLYGVYYNVYLCHLSEMHVKVGQTVSMGQQIGLTGNTGNSSGPHLHLEVRKSPYGFNPRDIVDPSVVYQYKGDIVQSPTLPTVFDLLTWNIARERWYTPWDRRAAEIQRELRDEASVNCFQELFEAKAINTAKAALPGQDFFSGPAGLEFAFDVRPNRWKYESGENLYSGIARRYAQHVVLRRRATGQLVDFYNVHAPIKAEGSGAKEAYGRWLAAQVKKAKNPAVIAGDLNAPDEDASPKRDLQALGFRSFKQQAKILNEGVKEFIPKGQDLCSIYTQPAGPADIIGGEVDISTTSFESDHRRLEARIVIAP